MKVASVVAVYGNLVIKRRGNTLFYIPNVRTTFLIIACSCAIETFMVWFRAVSLCSAFCFRICVLQNMTPMLRMSDFIFYRQRSNL